MDIRFYRAQEKLGIVRPELEVLADLPAVPCFWVVHPVGYSGAWGFYLDEAMNEVIVQCLNAGGAILFLSGTPYAGSAARANQLSNEHRRRIHCLNTSISGSESKVAERLLRFLKIVEELKPDEPIPWKEAEPASWPQNLVALYLVLKAMEYAPHDAESIREGWATMEQKWRRKLLTDALDEYEDNGFSEHEWLTLGFSCDENEPISLPPAQKLPMAVDALKRCLVH